MLNLDECKRIVIEGDEVVKLEVGGATIWERELPAGYRRVEYLRSHGSQYIRTLIPFHYDNTIVLRLKFDSNTPTRPSTPFRYFSTAKRDIIGQFQVYSNNPRGLVFFWGQTAYSYNYVMDDVTVPFTVRKLEHSIVVNEYTVAEFGDYTATENEQYVMFGNINFDMGQPYSLTDCMIYSLTIARDGVPITNLIPCYRISDMKPGYWCTVRKLFLTNYGSGEFYIDDEQYNAMRSNYTMNQVLDLMEGMA